MRSHPRSIGRGSSARRRTAALFAASALVLTACGNDNSTEEQAAQLAERGADSPSASTSAQPQSAGDTSLPGGTSLPGRDGGLVQIQNEEAADGTSAGGTAALTSENFFGPTSPWNTRIDDARVDPDSDQMILQSVRRLDANADADGDGDGRNLGANGNADDIVNDDDANVVNLDAGLYINTVSWTTPVVVGGEPTDVICRQIQCGDGDDTLVLNVPTDVDPDPRYDGWYTIFDETEGVAYDLWRARRESNGSITYHFMRTWDLDGPGYDTTTPPTRVSARGSGLPLFAGLIQPGELQRGEINHALAISVPAPAQGSYVAPASSTDGNGFLDSIPEGARIRLKDVDLPAPVDPVTGKKIKLTKAQVRQADAIRAALRTYGAIVVDRAAVPTLYAQRDVLADTINGQELQALRMEDFEVVTLGTSYPYPPEGDLEVNGLLPRAEPTNPSSQPSETQGAQ